MSGPGRLELWDGAPDVGNMVTANDVDFEDVQQGYFTAKQAIAAGFDQHNHPYHVRAANWIRKRRGIYRLALFPPADRPDLVIWSLWARDRKGTSQGTFSHETALSIYELSDAMPAALHMTVPPGFRRMAPIPKGLTLHRGSPIKEDIEDRHGYQLTRPLRTLADLLEEGRISPDLLRQAVQEAFERGLIRPASIQRATHLPPPVREKMEKLLKETAR